MKKWDVLESKYLYQTPHGNLRRDKCLVEGDFIIEAYHVNEFDHWVNAVVMTDQNEIVFVKQYRHGAGEFFYEIPAGKPEANESFAEAIQREVLEETGYQSDSAPILLGEFFVNPATQNNKVISYLIPNAVKTSEQNLDIGEVIDLKTIRFQEVGELIETGEIQQMFSVTAYFLARNYLNNKEISD